MIPQGWKQGTLGDDISLISGQHILAEDYTDKSDGIPYLTGPSDYYSGSIVPTKFTNTPKALCENGDILITVKGSGTGKSIVADDKYCISRQLMAIRPKSWDSYFVWSVVQLNEIRYEKASSGLIPGITRDEVLQTPILIPPLTEQHLIGDILLKWDHFIKLSESLISQKQKQRKWLTQQLLAENRRFSGFRRNWTIRNFGELIDPVQRPVPKPTEPYKALGIRSHCKGTFSRFVDDPSTVDMEELFVVGAGDLIVNITFAWEGAITFVPEEYDGYLVSHRFPTYRLKEDEVDADFLRYVVTHPRFIFQLGLISPGGAGRNRVMSKKDFLKIEIAVPNLYEQRKIGHFMKLIDTEIDLLNQQLDALRRQKKGLMQQLLTGKRRVKVL
jgi:type I restriction enzyme, S subunit